MGKTLEDIRKARSEALSPEKTRIHATLGKGTTPQPAKKLGVAFDFGWRSGSPLRQPPLF
jgi:hypothetical protein